VSSIRAGNAVVLSVDEKSQIQALDRTQPRLPDVADGEAAGGAVADFHFSDIPVRGDDGARAIGANDDATAAVELRGRRRQHP
jgi:hypothetical protein